MASQFQNHRRKSQGPSAHYQQIAGQVAKPGSSPLAARQPANKAAKVATRGVGTLRTSPAACGGPSWILLGLGAILLAAVLGLAFALWPSTTTSDARPTSAAAQKRSDAAKPAATTSISPDPPLDFNTPGLEPGLKEPPAEFPGLTWQQLLTRGDEQARARQWPKAAADFAAALRLNPDDHMSWFRGATLWAWVEDRSAYRDHCAAMLERFGQVTDPPIAERTAKSCLLAPGAVADMKAVVRLADQAVAATDHQYHAYFLMARGLAHYRTGEFDKALECASKSVSGNPRVIGLDVPAHLIVAMSHHRLGQSAEARQALGQAREIMAQDWFPQLNSGELTTAWWHDWLICQILHREAEGLIEGKKAR